MSSSRKTKTAASLLALVGILLILSGGYQGSKSGFLLIAGLLTLAWLFVVYFLVWSQRNRRSARQLLRSFTYRVDQARQQYANDPKSLDVSVIKAFDKLHADAAALLSQRALRIARLKREVLSTYVPRSSDSSDERRWRPPTLSEMGYALAVAEKYTRDAPVMALYKHSGEEPMRDGRLADTYTILKEGNLTGFSGQFDAKVRSPFLNALTPPAETPTPVEPVYQEAAPDATPDAVADAEHNVAYILSLLGPLKAISTQLLFENLAAMRALPLDALHREPLSAEAVRSWQRSVLTERIGYLASSLPLARRALCQAPQLMVAALADLYRRGNDDAEALSANLEAIADMLVPQHHQPRQEILSTLSELAHHVQSMTSIGEEQVFENPGVAYVDARGAEANAALLKRTAQLATQFLRDSAERAYRVYFICELSVDGFQSRLRGFRDLHGGEEDLNVIQSLLQALAERTLLLQTAEDTLPIRARELPSPAGHQSDNEVYVTANPAGFDLEGVSPEAYYVLCTLSGRARYTRVGDAQALVSIAHKLCG